VDSTNETMNAIANNGDVEILFYEEEEPILQRLNNIDWNPTYINTSNGGYVYGSTSGDIVGSSFTTTNLASFKSSDDTLSFSNNPRSSKYEKRELPERRLKSKSVETGRVEQGSSSDQSFKTVSKEFNSWTVSTSVWKLLPESQKPIEKSDLIHRCPKCSTRIKKSSWKFCPECGNELKQETYEDQLSKLSKEELIELLKNK
jgi:ribosomal protein L37AE/L43A